MAKKRTINEYRQVKDSNYVAPNSKTNQTIKDIHLINAGFVEYQGITPREYYKEYGGVRLDAVTTSQGWNIVIFHDTDPNQMTVIEDLDLFVELNNLLNKIQTTYDKAKSN
jgi:hypothetical protein